VAIPLLAVIIAAIAISKENTYWARIVIALDILWLGCAYQFFKLLGTGRDVQQDVHWSIVGLVDIPLLMLIAVWHLMPTTDAKGLVALAVILPPIPVFGVLYCNAAPLWARCLIGASGLVPLLVIGAPPPITLFVILSAMWLACVYIAFRWLGSLRVRRAARIGRTIALILIVANIWYLMPVGLWAKYWAQLVIALRTSDRLLGASQVWYFMPPLLTNAILALGAIWLGCMYVITWFPWRSREA
jgi:hypothetical protein